MRRRRPAGTPRVRGLISGRRLAVAPSGGAHEDPFEGCLLCDCADGADAC